MPAAPPVAPAAAAGMRWERAARALFLLAAMGAVTSPPVANIAAALGLISFLLMPGALGRLRAAARTPLGLGIGILLAALALAMLWAEGVPWARRFAAWWSWRPLVLLLVGTALFDSAPVRDGFARALVAFLALAAAISFVIYPIPGAIVIDEPGILLRNHVTQGMAFVVGAALAAMLAWGRPATARLRRAGIAAIVLFVANLATVTSGRSAHVGLLVLAAAGAYWLLRRRLRWQVLVPAMALVAVLCAGLLAAAPMVRHRFEAVVSEVDTAGTSKVATSSGIRLVIWSNTWQLIEQRPLLGYGMGGFIAAYDRQVNEHVQDTGNWRDAARAHDTHNEYLHVLVEAGVFGLVAFGVFAACLLRQPAPPPYRGCAIALFLTWLATSLFNSHFQTFAEAHLIGLVLGALLAVPAPSRPE